MKKSIIRKVKIKCGIIWKDFLSIMPRKLVVNIENLYFYGRFLNKKNIKYSGEKIKYLKLYGNLEKYTDYSDKYKVREYVTQKIGQEYLIPLIGVYNKPEDINYSLLPNEFVLKTNHGSGYNIIIEDKEKINIKETNKQLKVWLRKNYGKIKKEYQYKNIERKIICEKLIYDKEKTLLEYKFFCFDGKPKIIVVKTKDGEYACDIKWEKLDMYVTQKRKEELNKPKNFEKMIEIVTKLCEDFQFVRVDVYNIDGKIYFGELTFAHGSGNLTFQPLEKDIEIAKMIKI